MMRWHAERAQELFGRLDLGGARLTVLHGDFAPWNLLYTDGRLTGVLDFDATHLNFAVADFALSWRGHHDAVIDGYNEARPLTDLDRELITPAYWAWLFIGVADRIAAMTSGAAPPARFEWVISKLLLRSPVMGAESAAYRRT